MQKQQLNLLFTSSKCSHCDDAKKYLNEKGIKYREIENNLQNINKKNLFMIEFFPTMILIYNNTVTAKLVGFNKIKNLYEES